MASFHDQFVRDAEYPDWFHWTTQKPIFRESKVAYIPPYADEPEPNDVVEVTAFCENGNGFGEYHESAWRFLTDNASAVEEQLRRKLFAHHLRGYHGFMDQCVGTMDDDETDEWNQIKDSIIWNAPSAIDHLYELIGIGLIDDGMDGCGYCYFDFQCGWDEEHGISVLMHKSNVLAAGGMSEFCNRGPHLIPHVRSIQAYDFDEGDFPLGET